MKHQWLIRSLLLTAGCLLPFAGQALTLEQALQRLGQEVLRPSESADGIAAYLLPAPLASGEITPVSGSTPTIDIAALSGNPQWFALVDLFPCQLFQHEVKYVFIDDVTGVVTVFDADDWPALDGDQIRDPTVNGRLIVIYPIIPRPESFAASPSPAAPAGDYGDAPDGGLAYPTIIGRFPTLFATTNSMLGRPGGHVIETGLEMLGASVSAETDAADPADPDGVINLTDADADERMFLALNPNVSPAEGYLIVDVTVASGAPEMTRYLNVLFDFNQDGRWSGAAAGLEWPVVNQAIVVSPGTNATVVSTGFDWGSGAAHPTLVWMRVALTQSQIDGTPFGIAGWDGSGALGSGEIEDARIYLKGCPGEGTPPPPDDGGGDPPPETPPPGPPFGWNLLPVNFVSLVVQGVDHAGQNAAAQAAATMANTLNVQGYNNTSLSGAEATSEKIEEWINGILPGLSCQDHVLIYFIAHGAKDTPGGSMRLRAKSKSDPGTLTGSQLADLLALIPACRDEDCDSAGKSCSVTVIIESCYSGQFLNAVAGDGREIFTSSSGAEPSWFGADGTGGEYSDQYANCASGANSGVTDSNGDGFVTPGELHQWAAASLGRPQTPQSSSSLCPCECPWFWWECLLDPEGLVRFFPADITFNGAVIGQSFADAIEGLVLLPGVPRYDFVKVELPPNDWHWRVEVPSEGPPIPIHVTVIGVSATNRIRVPLFTLNGPPSGFPPLPLFLQISVPANQYVLRDNEGNALSQAQWHTFPESLDPILFHLLPAERSNGSPLPPIQTEILQLNLTSATPLLIRWSPRPNTDYYLEFTPNLGEPWETIQGPLAGRGYAILPDFEQGFFQVRGVPSVRSLPQ